MRQRKLLRSHLAYLTISIAVGIDPLVNSNGTDPLLLLLLLRPDLTSEKQKDSEDGEKKRKYWSQLFTFPSVRETLTKASSRTQSTIHTASPLSTNTKAEH